MYFTLWTEKVESKGEDAIPTLILKENQSGVLAVYDGLGGAGSKAYTIIKQGNEELYTGAYLGSRLAKSILEEIFLQDIEISDETISHLNEKFEIGFKEYFQSLTPQKSLLRSKLIKNLPTTLAGVYFETLEDNDLKIRPFWAGDSRCYILQTEGILQVTKDDLHGFPDALESLFEDATISNCLQAINKFTIHQQTYYVEGACVLITATDGCFAYLPSPAHFEYLLLESLMNSYYDIEDWKERLTEYLEKYTADDMSLSLVCIGFDNLNHLKTAFYPRFSELFQQYIQPLQEIDYKNERSLHSNHSEIQDSEIVKQRKLLSDLWERYKINYYPNDLM